VVKHYTQLPSELRTSCDARATFVHVRGGGFLTADMVGATLDQWAASDAMPTEVLVDLRDVAGYESGCAEMAHAFLESAMNHGVRRIAFVATSAVLRTGAKLVLSGSGVRVRFFSDEIAAKRWLERDEPSRVQPIDHSAVLRDS
ncbi:MAG TPA: STAS/SEC14 domain-containing protein, partial [Nannocystaceae bacterium]|nr:STAS/SEC14 domain-containing protein [Nannocystaceae bacterium]